MPGDKMNVDMLRESTPKTDAPMVGWALWLARAGGYVIPLHTWDDETGCSCGARLECSSPAKHPRTIDGLDSATTDLDLISRWWDMWPLSNPALLTGVTFDVIDVDDLTSFQDWLTGPIDRTFRVETSKGVHLYVKPTDHGNRNTSAAGRQYIPGADYRGRRGYVVAPGAIHQSGHRYTPTLDPIIGRYDWNDEALEASATKALPEVDVSNKPDLPDGVDGTSWGIDYLRRAGNAIIEADVGSRNDTLNRKAFFVWRLIKGKELDEGYAVNYLKWAASHHYGQDRFSSTETENTIKSAKAKAKPWQPASDAVPVPT